MIERLTYKKNGRIVHTPGSNFWIGRSPISAEHHFQSLKTHDMRWKARILGAHTPSEAKKLGRQAPLREDWMEVNVGEMRSVLVYKAMTEPDFVDWLLSTQGQKIYEGNWWHDNFWGRCECDSCVARGRTASAKNHLGRLLVQLRETIVSFGEE